MIGGLGLLVVGLFFFFFKASVKVCASVLNPVGQYMLKASSLIPFRTATFFLCVLDDFGYLRR